MGGNLAAKAGVLAICLGNLCAGGRLLGVLGGCCLKKLFCEGYIPNFGLPPETQFPGRGGLLSLTIKTFTPGPCQGQQTFHN